MIEVNLNYLAVFVVLVLFLYFSLLDRKAIHTLYGRGPYLQECSTWRIESGFSSNQAASSVSYLRGNDGLQLAELPQASLLWVAIGLHTREGVRDQRYRSRSQMEGRTWRESHCEGAIPQQHRYLLWEPWCMEEFSCRAIAVWSRRNKQTKSPKRFRSHPQPLLMLSRLFCNLTTEAAAVETKWRRSVRCKLLS